MDHRRRFSAFVARGCDPRPVIVDALEFARDFLPQSSLDERSRMKVAIIVEELTSNTLRHGIREKDVSLLLLLEDRRGQVELRIDDDAPAFDPTERLEFAGPDPFSGGGIGLAIVRAWAEDITYSRDGDRNVLRMAIR